MAVLVGVKSPMPDVRMVEPNPPLRLDEGLLINDFPNEGVVGLLAVTGGGLIGEDWEPKRLMSVPMPYQRDCIQIRTWVPESPHVRPTYAE